MKLSDLPSRKVSPLGADEPEQDTRIATLMEIREGRTKMRSKGMAGVDIDAAHGYDSPTLTRQARQDGRNWKPGVGR